MSVLFAVDFFVVFAGEVFDLLFHGGHAGFDVNDAQQHPAGNSQANGLEDGVGVYHITT
jgi:hypothetical protein